VIERVIPEEDAQELYAGLKQSLYDTLRAYIGSGSNELAQRRYARFRNIGGKPQ